MTKEELNLIQFAAGQMAKCAQVQRRSWGSSFSMSARAAAALTTSQSAFVIPSPQIRPVLLIARKTAPCVMPAAVVHVSIAAVDPGRHRNRADVSAFANEIRNDPMLLALLQ